MRSAEALKRTLATALLALLAACGGGSSSETTLITRDGAVPVARGVERSITEPQGDNTTEVVVDSGPGGGFALGVANLPYVTVTVCRPGSASACVTIDHVFLDTGSIGLRLLRSAVAGLDLPLQAEGAGTVSECFPFVIGAVWGPLASADLRIGGESAAGLTVQLIDDGASPQVAAPPADCLAAANGELLRSMGSLQAKGVLGVGMLGYDCGLRCEMGDYSGGYTLYYRCSGGSCAPLALPAERQVQNPVVHFAVNNNGSILVLPALPDTGAALARGRLVFGIGTQANNQLPPEATLLFLQNDPASDAYLYLETTVGGTTYPYSYVDSGSNGLFFDDPALAGRCTGAGATWYCPQSPAPREATIADALGNRAIVSLSIASADLLFVSGNVAFANLGGSAGASNPGAFVWGLPFFYGRRVTTAIWGQALAVNGPWVAF
ncbi:conserved exported hypothetical protein [Rubrivivax sp. A210]|uniref:DUF3443 family protein n=1 Tax=Rubrivivax sp. A210 TaxID=2772301 RepID=UPI00191A0E4C|nr:DUF3443 family protein [Rubrivivax sp. A210]CAD5366374.1 conserved exported hypothetical protein [Rubrivivax sp. A210]